MMPRVICLVLAAALSTACIANEQARTTERSMDLTLRAPAARAFPLFGPKRESEWAPEWNPLFLQPADGEQLPEGAVFLTSGKHGQAIWTVSRYDETAGAIDYVRVAPERLVTRITIRVMAAQTGSTAQVIYRLTSLGAEGDALIDDFNATWPKQKAEWEDAINQLLESGRRPPHHGHE
jgi:hypothetical protein